MDASAAMGVETQNAARCFLISDLEIDIESKVEVRAKAVGAVEKDASIWYFNRNTGMRHTFVDNDGQKNDYRQFGCFVSLKSGTQCQAIS